MSKGGQALPEDLLSMGHEQQRVDQVGLVEAPIVEAGHDGLAGTGGHHHQVAPAPVNFPFGPQLIQDLLLVAIWTNFQRRQLKWQIHRPASFSGQRLIQPIALPGVVRVVGLEGGIFPVLIEGGAKGVQQMTLLVSR